MMELFEDFTIDKHDDKTVRMIKKREFNPKISLYSNMVLDLIDFKDRVRPMSKDIAMMEHTSKY